MTAHPQADLLQQLADEAKVNPRYWEAFQWRFTHEKWWRDETSPDGLFESICESGMEVRRKPRTIRVSGEVPEEALQNAVAWRRYGEGASVDHDAIVDALLSLVEES